MAAQPEITNMALLCYLKNIALGVREEKQTPFGIRKVLKRLLLEDSVVVKKPIAIGNVTRNLRPPCTRRRLN